MKKDRTNKNRIEQIILQKYNQYYRLAYSYAHNEADASDIVQNGAYKAIRSEYSLKKPEYAKNWVYRIMLNECFQYLKQPWLLSYEAVRDENGTEAGDVEDHYLNLDLHRALDALTKRVML